MAYHDAEEDKHTINYSQAHANHDIVTKLKEKEGLSLIPSKTSLGKQVDFIIGKFGCVYIDENDMNGQVKSFLPRILALKYEEYYDITKNPNNNILNTNDENSEKTKNENQNKNKSKKKKAPKKFDKTMVFIHYCNDNSNKVMRLQLFLMEYDINCLVVESDDTVIDLLIKKAFDRLHVFIAQPKSDDIINNDWNDRLLPGSITNTVSKIPNIKENETSDVMNYFQDIGTIANADESKLKNYFKTRKAKKIHEFFN